MLYSYRINTTLTNLEESMQKLKLFTLITLSFATFNLQFAGEQPRIYELMEPAHPTNYSPLHKAAAMGNCAQVEKLLSENKYSVNARDQYNTTPLHEAAMNGNFNMVQLLLTHNADINAQNNSGSTALHLATSNNHKTITELLLNHKPDRSKKNIRQRGHLTVAENKNHQTITRIIEKHDAERTQQPGTLRRIVRSITSSTLLNLKYNEMFQTLFFSRQQKARPNLAEVFGDESESDPEYATVRFIQDGNDSDDDEETGTMIIKDGVNSLEHKLQRNYPELQNANLYPEIPEQPTATVTITPEKSNSAAPKVSILQKIKHHIRSISCIFTGGSLGLLTCKKAYRNFSQFGTRYALKHSFWPVLATASATVATYYASPKVMQIINRLTPKCATAYQNVIQKVRSKLA